MLCLELLWLRQTWQPCISILHLTYRTVLHSSTAGTLAPQVLSLKDKQLPGWAEAARLAALPSLAVLHIMPSHHTV